MYIIFNKDEKVVGYCDYEPNIEDLQSRGEFCVFSSEYIEKPFDVVLGKYGTVFEPAPTPKTADQIQQELTVSTLRLREKKLSETDWLVTRHLEQKMLEIPQTLSIVEFNNLLSYRQQLRDITLSPDFPNCAIPELLI